VDLTTQRRTILKEKVNIPTPNLGELGGKGERQWAENTVSFPRGGSRKPELVNTTGRSIHEKKKGQETGQNPGKGGYTHREKEGKEERGGKKKDKKQDLGIGANC